MDNSKFFFSSHDTDLRQTPKFEINYPYVNVITKVNLKNLKVLGHDNYDDVFDVQNYDDFFDVQNRSQSKETSK